MMKITIELTPQMASLILEARKYNREFVSRRAARIRQREDYQSLSTEEKMQKRGGFNRDKPETASWGKWKAAEQELGKLMFFVPVMDEDLIQLAEGFLQNDSGEETSDTR